MNVPTLIIVIILAVLVVFIIRYLRRTGPCAGCASRGSCTGSCSRVPAGKKPEIQPADAETQAKLDRIDAIIDKHKQ